MPHWTYHHDPRTTTHHWWECDDTGSLLRQASFVTGPEHPAPPHLPQLLAEHAAGEERFAGSDGLAVTAADRAELTWLRDEFAQLGAELYEATYGIVTDRPGRDGRPVTATDFERAWQRARRDRNFTRITTGPLPVGLRLSGTVSRLPWGAGVTGLFVDLGLPINGFVDMGQLPGQPELWPTVGTAAEFEIVTVRIDCSGSGLTQIRLRPHSAAASGSGRPSPHPAPR